MASFHSSNPIPHNQKPPDPQLSAILDVASSFDVYRKSYDPQIRVQPPQQHHSNPITSNANGDPHPPTEQSLTFAALVAKSATTPRLPELSLPVRHYGIKDGMPSLSFSTSEYQAATKRLEHTLIAKFQMGRPPLTEIRNFMAAKWGFTGRCSISPCWDDRHIVVILDNETDVRVALTHPIRKIGHTYFRLFRWEQGYNPKKEIPRTTKWVRLPNLPIELFDKAIIKAIVSSFATFLDVDARTKDMSALAFARACVELDVTKSIPSKVWINLPGDRGFYQDIVVEGGISYCNRCKMHGHDLASCRKGKRSLNPSSVKVPKETNVGPIASSDYGPDNLLLVTVPKDQPTSKGEWQVVSKRKAVRGQRIQPTSHNDLLESHNALKDTGVSKVVEGSQYSKEKDSAEGSKVGVQDSERLLHTEAVNNTNLNTVPKERDLNIVQRPNIIAAPQSFVRSYSMANCKNCPSNFDQVEQQGPSSRSLALGSKEGSETTTSHCEGDHVTESLDNSSHEEASDILTHLVPHV